LYCVFQIIKKNLIYIYIIINYRCNRDADERHEGRVKTKIVVVDLTSLGGDVPLANSYNEVRQKLGRMDVRLLVNNAGMSYKRPERLLDLAATCTGALPDPCRDMVECNALATVAMCRIVMPLMVGGGDVDGDDGCGGEDASEKTSLRREGGGGVVINVSSASAQLPCPLISVYGATKVKRVLILYYYH